MRLILITKESKNKHRTLLFMRQSFLARKFGLGNKVTTKLENSKNSSPLRQALGSLILLPVAREVKDKAIYMES